MPRSPLHILLWLVVLIVVIYVLVVLLRGIGAEAATLGAALALPSTFRRWRL